MSTVKSQPRTKNGASQRTQNQRWRLMQQKSLRKYQEKRITQLKEKTITKKSTQPNSESALTKLLKPIYSQLRIDYLQHNRLCLAKLPGCKEHACEIHHRYLRTGWWLIVMDLFFPICRNCHRFITKNSRWAISEGISISRHSDLQLSFNKHTIEVMKKFGVDPPI
jgi:hypothetical protein